MRHGRCRPSLRTTPTASPMRDYQKKALRTLSTNFHMDFATHGDEPEAVSPDLLHGAIGLATEAGELLDALKRAMYYGARLDRTNIIEELGDLEWYLALIREALGVSQDDVQRINIEKLTARYPERFTSDGALNRDLTRERAVLERA